MDNVNIIFSSFPELSDIQKEQFSLLGELYSSWNEKVNVISRKDIENLYLRHVMHSLALGKLWGNLSDDTEILDIGTGGGFPGIPLSILYPNCRFHLIDRIGKKIKVADSIASEIGLNNIDFQHGDIGECHKKFDYVVSRAVMALDKLVKLTVKNVLPQKIAHENKFSPGIFALKGGDLEQESGSLPYPVISYNIHEFFTDDFFDTKLIVYVPIDKK